MINYKVVLIAIVFLGMAFLGYSLYFEPKPAQPQPKVSENSTLNTEPPIFNFIYRTGSFQGTVDKPVPCREKIKLFDGSVSRELIDLCKKKLSAWGWMDKSNMLVYNSEQKILQTFDVATGELKPVSGVTPEQKDYFLQGVVDISAPLVAKLVAENEPKLLEEILKRQLIPQDIWISDSAIDLIAVREKCTLYSFNRASKQLEEKFSVPAGWDWTDVFEGQELCMRFLNKGEGIYTLADYPSGRTHETYVVRFENSSTKKISDTIKSIWFANGYVVGYVVIDSKEYKNRLATLNVKNGTTKELSLEGHLGGPGSTGLYSFSRSNNNIVYSAIADENYPLDTNRCGLTLYSLDLQKEQSKTIEKIGCASKDYIYDISWSSL